MGSADYPSPGCASVKRGRGIANGRGQESEEGLERVCKDIVGERDGSFMQGAIVNQSQRP